MVQGSDLKLGSYKDCEEEKCWMQEQWLFSFVKTGNKFCSEYNSIRDKVSNLKLDRWPWKEVALCNVQKP